MKAVLAGTTLAEADEKIALVRERLTQGMIRAERFAGQREARVKAVGPDLDRHAIAGARRGDVRPAPGARDAAREPERRESHCEAHSLRHRSWRPDHCVPPLAQPVYEA